VRRGVLLGFKKPEKTIHIRIERQN